MGDVSIILPKCTKEIKHKVKQHRKMKTRAKSYEKDENSTNKEKKNQTDDESFQRFHEVTDEDLENLAKSNNTEKTRKQTSWAANIFKEWLSNRPKEDNCKINFEQYSKKELADLLIRFYPSVRTKTGEVYAKQTLINIRSGLNRYLTMPPINYDWNLMTDKEFFYANKILNGVHRKNKQDGHDKSKRKPVLSANDIRQIYSNYFDPNYDRDPTCLQHKVYFELAYYLARRGKEGLRDLRKDSFDIKTTEEGREYLQLSYHERTKKCQGNEYIPYEDENIILSQPGSIRCPIHSFKLYLSKLSPESNVLFQRPNPRFYKKENEDWYIADHVGVNTIGTFLRTISENANLKTKYTNHCLRGTTATAMFKLGYSVPEIANVTKHRNHQSLEHYLQKPNLEEKSEICTSLFNFVSDHTNNTDLSTEGTQSIRNTEIDDMENWDTDILTNSYESDDEISFKPRKGGNDEKCMAGREEEEKAGRDKKEDDEEENQLLISERNGNEPTQELDTQQGIKIQYNADNTSKEPTALPDSGYLPLLTPQSQLLPSFPSSSPSPLLTLTPRPPAPPPPPPVSLSPTNFQDKDDIVFQRSKDMLSGLFSGAQLSGCTLHFNVSK